MIRNEKLEDISDGRLYDANDMVKAYCDECKGCHACCTGMGSSIILDPLDVMRLCKETGKNFTQLLEKELEVNVVDGLVLPNIRMTADKRPSTIGCLKTSAIGMASAASTCMGKNSRRNRNFFIFDGMPPFAN